MGDLVLDDAIHDDHPRQTIYHAIPRVTLQAAVNEAHRLRRPNGYFDCPDDQYSYVRQFTPQLLDTLSFASHQDDHPVLEGMAVLHVLNTIKRRELPDNAPVDFAPDQWRRFVMPDAQPAGYCGLGGPRVGSLRLTGIQLSPRLRDLDDRQLCKLITDARIYPRPDAQPTGPIDLTRLLARWDDLAHLAGSLKRGYMTASLLISRLQASPRQGQLTRLLQEYGRLVNTIFVLRYLVEGALRHRIRAQLNKGEKLHGLRKFLLFAREGMVSQPHEEGQGDQVACLHLLTHAVIIWNTVYMQDTLETFRHEGYPMQKEDLVRLWPTRFAHVHRYGKYVFKVETARARTGLRPLDQ
jgi:hypothetical protein